MTDDLFLGFFLGFSCGGLIWLLLFSFLFFGDRGGALLKEPVFVPGMNYKLPDGQLITITRVHISQANPRSSEVYYRRLNEDFETLNLPYRQAQEILKQVNLG